MQVRFGYVSIALNIPNGKATKSVTVKTLQKINNRQEQLQFLRSILRQNLESTMRILHYNVTKGIEIYRMTTKTVPLASHEITSDWDYLSEFHEQIENIGQFIRSSGLRISVHPEHYTILNSNKPGVLEVSLKDLHYHTEFFSALKLPAHPQIVLHIGGVYGDKQQAKVRFIETYHRLPENIQKRLMLENDDKCFSAKDVLDICHITKCPMVLDLHHHLCLNNGESLDLLWPEIAKTWGPHTPKVHISSPRDLSNMRCHADYINPNDILPFLKTACQNNSALDIMIEAKQKDKALFQLLADLTDIRYIKRIGPASIEL